MGLILLSTPTIGFSQTGSPRSLESLTASSGDDVRSSWVNPAGLAVKVEASIMAEFRVDRPDSGDLRLGQYSLGFNSRGFSLIYQRDRFSTGSSGKTWRFSVANRFTGGSIGIAYTLYKGTGQSDTGFDVGVRYLAARGLDFGAVVRHLGRPKVRGDTLNPTVVGSVSFIPINTVRLSSEVSAMDRAEVTGFDLTYRASLSIGSPSSKTGLVAVLTLNDRFSVSRVGFGLSFGGNNRVSGFATVARNTGTTAIDAVSLTGVSTRDFSSRRPSRRR